MKEDNRERGSAKQLTKINIDSQLHCPHDLSKLQEFRDDLPTLLDSLDKANIADDLKQSNIFIRASLKLDIESAKSSLSVFDSPENSDNEVRNIFIIQILHE